MLENQWEGESIFVTVRQPLDFSGLLCAAVPVSIFLHLFLSVYSERGVDFTVRHSVCFIASYMT